MFTLVLEPMTLIDFGSLSTLDVLNGDDLSPPGIMQCWPLTTQSNNTYRTRWSASQQREMFLHDPTTRFMKVVDASNLSRPILAVGRWHRYEKPFSAGGDLPLELYGRQAHASNAEAVQHGMIGDAHRTLVTDWLCSRPDWIAPGPHWLLTTLKTREPERRRGAGSLLIKWGVDEAKKERIPAYLEAVPDAKSLYEKFGFHQIGTQTIDLRPHGQDEVLVLARMAANTASSD